MISYVKLLFDDAASYISHDKDTCNIHGLMANHWAGAARLKCNSGTGVQGCKMVGEGMECGGNFQTFYHN